MKKYFTYLFSFCFCFAASAQEKLTLQEAIELVLKNNYSILIVKNETEIAKNNNSLGNAGFLPQVNLNASANNANNNTNQNYASGLEVNKSGVQSSNINSSVSLNWVLFDGMKMFATREKLKELEAMGELNIKIQIENTLEKTIIAYCDIVKQKQLLKAINEAISISEERVKIADTKFNIGSSSKVDLLQAKVDLNEQKSAMLQQQTMLTESKENINLLLARAVETTFDVDDSVVISTQPQLEELKTLTEKQNNSLLFFQRNINVSNYSLKEIQAQRLPKITFNSNYVFSRTENQAGFILLNQNLGLNYGFVLSMPLFNGWTLNTQVKNAQLSLLNTKMELEQTKKEIENNLIRAYQRFQNYLQIFHLEEENLKLAKENVDIALERFRLGASNSIELKQAEQSYEDAMSRLATARFNTKSSETELMKLNGGLVR